MILNICISIMNLQIDINQFICPITHLIFNDPVLADDSNIYERYAIEEWLTNNKTSPLTKTEMSNKVIGCRAIKNQIDDILKTYPELTGQQYIPTIDNIIQSKNYVALQKHQRIDLKYLMDNHFLKPILKYADIQTLKHLIDNALDLNCKSKHNSRMIDYVCESAVLEIVEYMLTKDTSIDIESKNDYGMTSLHYACRSNPNLNVIKYLVDKGVDIECEDNDGWRPLHYICLYRNSEAIHYIFNKRVDLSRRVTKYKGNGVDWDFIKLIRMNSNGKL